MLTLRNLAGIAHPPYLFQPAQIVSRVWRDLAWRSSVRQTVRLPWGLDITVNPQEAVGRNICTRGLYDLPVTETLWRLADPGEVAVDVGANIGYTAGLFAIRVGPKGRVHCFEPHPEIFRRLCENITGWRAGGKCGELIPYELAVGAARGIATLQASNWFDKNNGTARIVSGTGGSDGLAIEVRVGALDDVLPENEKVGIVKIDAEGSELEILKGMRRLLNQRRVRDIVYEEASGFSAPTHDLLLSYGYTVFGLEEGILGVACVRGRAPARPADADPPSYLATLDPDRALRRLARKGWQSFGLLSWAWRRRTVANG